MRQEHVIPDLVPVLPESDVVVLPPCPEAEGRAWKRAVEAMDDMGRLCDAKRHAATEKPEAA